MVQAGAPLIISAWKNISNSTLRYWKSPALISRLSNRLGVEMEIYILFIFFSDPKKMIYVGFVVGCKRLESAVSWPLAAEMSSREVLERQLPNSHKSRHCGSYEKWSKLTEVRYRPCFPLYHGHIELSIFYLFCHSAFNSAHSTLSPAR